MSKTVTGFVVGVAIALGGAVMLSSSNAGAGPGDLDATFVPITPCRLFDLRTSDFGLRTAPLAPGEKLIQQVRGEQGACNLPDDVVGVSMNVTIVEPTAASYLTVFPGRASRPLSSNLNWVAGQAATPNKVDVAVSKNDSVGGGGEVAFYNAFGTVYVVADVVGYYTDVTLDQIGSKLTELEDALPVLGVFDGMSPETSEGNPPGSAGERYAKVTATATIDFDTDGVDAGSCTITGGVRVGGEPVEFSDAGTPESQMRFPITVIQVLERTSRPDGYGSVTNGHALECTTTSGAFDVLNSSIIIETYDDVLGDYWRPIG